MPVLLTLEVCALLILLMLAALYNLSNFLQDSLCLQPAVDLQLPKA